MYALLQGLKSCKDRIVNGRLIYLTDSQSCDLICRKGSGKMNLHILAKEIDSFVKLYNIDFSTAWLKRELNAEADELSKFKDPDNWTISDLLFDKLKILTKFEFTLDTFASSVNNKCDKFYSKFMCPTTAGVNGLAFSWAGETCWVCPPPSLSLKALTHFRDCRAKGIFVMPDWVSLPLLPLLNVNFFKDYILNDWTFPANVFVIKDESCNIEMKAVRTIVFDFSMNV